MSAELLLREFERMADQSGAPGMLRQFVLDMAIRGRLVPQIASEKATSQSILRPGPVATPRELLARRKSVRSLDIPIDSLPFTVPTTWDWVPLISVCEVTYGFAFNSALFGPRGTGRPLVRIRDISSTDTAAYFTGPFDTHYLIRPGDYLVGMDGDFNVRRWEGPEALLNQRVLRMSSWKPGISPGWVRMPLQSILDHLHEATSQTTVKHLSAKQVNGIRIPLPPPAEQHRIVAKVDELMALCDQLEAAQKEREARRDRLRAASLNRLTASDGDRASMTADVHFFLDQSERLITKPDLAPVRQAILDLAVQGRLVPQDHTLAVANSDKQLPASWTELPLGDLLAEDSRNGYSRKPDGAPDGIPILKISAGTLRGDGIVAEEEHKLIGKVSAQERAQYRLFSGDLLACRFNGNRDSVGLLAIFRDLKHIDPIFPDKLIRIRVDRSQVLPELLRWFSRSTPFRNRIASFTTTTVGNWGISAANLKKVLTALPPIEEQHRIAAKVDELMTLCDQLEAALASAQAGRARLLEALLQEALEDGTVRNSVGTGTAV